MGLKLGLGLGLGLGYLYTRWMHIQAVARAIHRGEKPPEPTAALKSGWLAVTGEKVVYRLRGFGAVQNVQDVGYGGVRVALDMRWGHRSRGEAGGHGSRGHGSRGDEVCTRCKADGLLSAGK